MRKLLPDILIVCCLFTYIAAAYLFSRHTSYYNVYSLAGRDSISFEKALVLSVDSEKLQEHRSQKQLLIGYQELTVRILTGPFTGRIFRTTNNLNYDASYRVKEREKIIVSVNATGDGQTVNVFVNTPDRLPWLYFFSGILILLLCITGGKRGFRAAAGIIFTLSSILFVFIPLLYRGLSPIPASFILAAATACVTLPLTGGTNRKTAAAILGTLVCVGISVAVQAIFCHLTQTSGYTFGDTDSLIEISAHTGLKIGGLLFASVLISSLGAVMDISISVASSVNEVSNNNPTAGTRELFRSGMNVGRDMMGTMSNTLILAFTGSALVTLIQIYTYNMQYYQVLNSNSIAVEIIQSLTGSFAVIIAVPVVSMISAQILSRSGKTISRT